MFLNMHIKFHLNWMLFTIRSIKLFLCIILDHKNLKFKHLIDDIAINIWYSWNFASMEDIIRTYNPTIRFSKFTPNKNIYERSLKGFFPNFFKDKLLLTHLWFGRNLNCLFVVWNLTFYPPKVSSVKFP